MSEYPGQQQPEFGLGAILTFFLIGFGVYWGINSVNSGPSDRDIVLACLEDTISRNTINHGDVVMNRLYTLRLQEHEVVITDRRNDLVAQVLTVDLADQRHPIYVLCYY